MLAQRYRIRISYDVITSHNVNMVSSNPTLVSHGHLLSPFYFDAVPSFSFSFCIVMPSSDIRYKFDIFAHIMEWNSFSNLDSGSSTVGVIS